MQKSFYEQRTRIELVHERGARGVELRGERGLLCQRLCQRRAEARSRRVGVRPAAPELVEKQAKKAGPNLAI
jgi:hypothetical protein